jgi:hypothetical protein
MRHNRFFPAATVLLAVLAAGSPFLGSGTGQDLDKFVRVTGTSPAPPPVVHPGRFSGYTNYWQTIAWSWRQHGNLFLIGQPDVAQAIAQNKADIAEELGLAGLRVEEGFLDAWLTNVVTAIEDPGEDDLEKALGRGDVLAWIDPASPLSRKLIIHGSDLVLDLSDHHQFFAAGKHIILAFVLSDGKRRLFVVTVKDGPDRQRFRELLAGLREVITGYDLHRGWFGTGTLLHSVTCHPGHPLEVIGQGLDQGNDWFTFSGYMDYRMRDRLPAWLAEVGLSDVVVDFGIGKATHSLGSVAYGLRDYDGLKIQDTPSEEEWIRFVKDRGGHIFRPVYAPECDKYVYDGQIAVDGNKRQIDAENTPFILQTGLIKDEAPACMVLFSEKGRRWDREGLWRALLERRAVGILPQGRMMGPARFRNALQLLLLDRAYLEDLFADRVRLDASFNGRYELRIGLADFGDLPVDANLRVRSGPDLTVNEMSMGTPVGIPGVPRKAGPSSREIEIGMSLAARTERSIPFGIMPSGAAMGKANPILVELRWKGGRKRALTVLDLPPAISVHKLLYGQAPEVMFPVSVHNFTEAESYSVEVKVFTKDNPAVLVLTTALPGTARTGEHQALEFKLPLRPGSYTVKTTALGVTAESQLGVGEPAGQVSVTPVDLDGDGLLEYRLENDKVRVTLLAIGARVIEYIVKERNDNVLFKLWPEKEPSDRRPFRERGFYPYGGFEDFLGQASIETHKVYDAEIVKNGGTSASVRMRADYYGNRLEKVFTLDGASPLLEVRFALEFRNPELNMLGPQPILALGEKHWTEDVFVVPSKAGLREFRMRPEEYFGEVVFLKEGWNAGRDTVEDVSFVGAFPVSEPEFLHVWMNHPSNGESAHYYAEFQPWVPIFQKTVRYFSYYLWGAAGPWERGLEELRRRNLVTTAK